MIFWFFLIFIFSFILALLSMKDFSPPKEIKYFFDAKRIKGTILFLKEKIMHYH